MIESEGTVAIYQAELNELSFRIEQAQANENVIEREAALDFLMEEYWLIEALLADLPQTTPMSDDKTE